MADQQQQPKKPEASPSPPALTMRQQVAVAIASAFVARHGGLGSAVEREANARMIWTFADSLIAAEGLPPLEPEKPVVYETAPATHKRRSYPSDEFHVRDQERVRKGFMTYEEAEAYARARPGAEVVQASGPGAKQLVTTD